MKNIFILVILTIAIPVLAQEEILKQKVSLQVITTPLEDIVTDLSARYGLSFSYGRDNVPLHEKVSIKRYHVPLDSLLDELFSPAHITFALMENQIVLRKEMSTQSVTAGNLRQFNGIVVNQTTGATLPNATISLRGRSIGTISNILGEFSFVFVPDQDTLNISYIGYESRKVLVDSISTPYLRIALKPTQTMLTTVEVVPQEALSVLQEALRRIPENYSMQPFRQQFYIRDRSWMDGQPIKASESLYEAYRGDLSGPEYHAQVKLIEGRKSVYNDRYFDILQALRSLNSFDIGLNAYFIFTVDIPKYVSHDVFLGKGNLKHYTFELGDNTSYDGHNIYVVNFDQKDGNKALLKGKIYIDTETYAIIHISQSLSPKGLANATIFGPKVMEKIFGLGESVLIGITQEFHFREVDGKWFADYVSHKTEMSLIKKKRDFNASLTSETNIVVTDIHTGDVKPFSDKEVADARALAYRQYGDYHEAFWVGQNIIKPDPEFEESFYRIEASNGKQDKAVDDIIWDRMHRKARKGNGPRADSLQRASALAQSDAEENKTGDWSDVDLDQRRNTKRFSIHYNLRDSAVIDSILDELNRHYDRILATYKIRKLPRIDAYVYPSVEDYHGAINYPNAPAWMVGSATIDKFSIVSPLNPGPIHSYDDVMRGVIHEFMHCVHIHVLRNNMGKARNNEARWLWEGLACYVAQQYVDPKTLEYLVTGNFPTLDDLNSITQSEKIYEVGFVLIEYIKSTWGSKGLIRLIKSNADIEGTFNISETDFERGFNEFVRKKL